MEKRKQTFEKIDITLKPNDGHKRTVEEKQIIAAAAKTHNAGRSLARRIRNEMLAIRYQMEDYISDQDVEEIRTIRDFVNDFLRILNLKKGDFVSFIEMDLGNLNKYYKDERKFNSELALKFGHFFHTPADLWLKVHFKNEMIKFEDEIKSEDKYKKYDYEKALQIA